MKMDLSLVIFYRSSTAWSAGKSRIKQGTTSAELPRSKLPERDAGTELSAGFGSDVVNSEQAARPTAAKRVRRVRGFMSGYCWYVELKWRELDVGSAEPHIRSARKRAGLRRRTYYAASFSIFSRTN